MKKIPLNELHLLLDSSYPSRQNIPSGAGNLSPHCQVREGTLTVLNFVLQAERHFWGR